MAKREDGEDALHKLLFDHLRRTDEIHRRAKEDQQDFAELYEEAERADAWLKGHWRTLDYNEEKGEFAIPDGWPAGHVRKPKQATPPSDEPKDEAPPDTMMHRMLKEKRGR